MEPGDVTPTLARARAKLAGRLERRGFNPEGLSVTVPDSPLTAAEMAFGAENPTPDVDRPRTRADCEGGPRPCPFVSCKHHLYLDVQRNGSLKLNFPLIEPWQMRRSCSLDVADRGATTLDAAGAALNVTRERVRQMEVKILDRVRRFNSDELVAPEDADRRSPMAALADQG